jgi:hypothetical protein
MTNYRENDLSEWLKWYGTVETKCRSVFQISSQENEADFARSAIAIRLKEIYSAIEDNPHKLSPNDYAAFVEKCRMVEAIIAELNLIQSKRPAVCELMKTKLMSGNDRGNNFGSRAELMIAAFFCHKDIQFTMPDLTSIRDNAASQERPDFVVKWKGHDLIIEVTSANFEKPNESLDAVKTKVKRKLNEKASKSYAGLSAAVIVDMTNPHSFARGDVHLFATRTSATEFMLECQRGKQVRFGILMLASWIFDPLTLSLKPGFYWNEEPDVEPVLFDFFNEVLKKTYPVAYNQKVPREII